jgi:hypothetical protein
MYTVTAMGVTEQVPSLSSLFIQISLFVSKSVLHVITCQKALLDRFEVIKSTRFLSQHRYKLKKKLSAPRE